MNTGMVSMPNQENHQTPNIIMKKFISCALAAVIVLAVPGMALAGNKANKPAAGKVTAVDTTANTITIAKGKKDSVTYKAAEAKITVNGAPGKLSDVTVGMKAQVTLGASPDTASAIVATTHKKGGKHNTTPPPAT